jgi:hypothetical protein
VGCAGAAQSPVHWKAIPCEGGGIAATLVSCMGVWAVIPHPTGKQESPEVIPMGGFTKKAFAVDAAERAGWTITREC